MCDSNNGNNTSAAIKHDQDKPRICLLDSDWLYQTAMAVEYIYTHHYQVILSDNDQKLSAATAYYILMKLLLDWNKGQDVDKDSQIPILHLVSAWSMIMSCEPKSKNDVDKILNDHMMVGLLEASWILGCSNVMTFGAKKYNPYNWTKGFPTTRLYDALMRHLLETRSNPQSVDVESKILHVYHLGCNAMMLCAQSNKLNLDDRHVVNAKSLK